MAIPSRYAVAIHILTFLEDGKGKDTTSDTIAESVGTNPAIVRTLIGKLRKAGLVYTRQGVPGASLTKPASEIRLSDIYRAIEASECLFNVHDHPKQDCSVGMGILPTLECMFAQAQAALEDKLGEFSLEDVMKQVRGECQKKMSLSH
ncbi:Rrf2 family transcriptional regulator [Leptospira yasudae]|uniref:Rrf2 family transcriptional regulator n=1 Tax=Leptospira yasudae TaxID=2202201 RepID=UPI001C5000BB|nr:Rrf2 family transcriptional regulator [Leptospira yasudae]MBW0432561.1 Rrf2 family transcriptional regulator [Leptospira yasudae]